jgi:hypothetical protein
MIFNDYASLGNTMHSSLAILGLSTAASTAGSSELLSGAEPLVLEVAAGLSAEHLGNGCLEQSLPQALM